MTRRADERLADIVAAANAIAIHLQRGTLEDPLVYDAVCLRILEIGEATRNIDQRILDLEPQIPWRLIGDMRNRLAHQYFDIEISIVMSVVNEHLDLLVAAVKRLLNS